jgi:hypothetical protein
LTTLVLSLTDSRGSAGFVIGFILLWSAHLALFVGKVSFAYTLIIRNRIAVTVVLGEVLKRSWENFAGVSIIRNWFAVIAG